MVGEIRPNTSGMAEMKNKIPALVEGLLATSTFTLRISVATVHSMPRTRCTSKDVKSVIGRQAGARLGSGMDLMTS